MKKLLLLAVLAIPLRYAVADDPAFFKYGPLSLNVPLKTVAVTHMYDFNEDRNLVGGETAIVSLWNRIEGTIGAVTSLDGHGTPFVGGNVLIGNLVDKYITLPLDFKIGGFGGYDFNADKTIYGIKTSLKIW